MSRSIRVDEQVYAELQRQAKPFEDTPNSVLRRVLGLEQVHKEELSMPSVYLVPHSPKEFEDANDLAAWLEDDLRNPDGRNGVYFVASAHYWRNIPAGSVCLLHKDKCIVGEGKLAEGLQPCSTSELSSVTGKPYEGQVRFDANTIKVYNPFLPFPQMETALGKSLTYRGVQKLTWGDYQKVQAIVLHEAKPQLVDKDGVLVVQSVALGELDGIERRERETRLAEMVQRAKP